MTHNAFSNANQPPLPGVQRLTFFNQEDTVTNQLRVIKDDSSHYYFTLFLIFVVKKLFLMFGFTFFAVEWS